MVAPVGKQRGATMYVVRGDLEIVFYEHHSGEDMEQLVLISLAGGRAETTLTLQQFCELVAECKAQIRKLHWGGAGAHIDF